MTQGQNDEPRPGKGRGSEPKTGQTPKSTKKVSEIQDANGSGAVLPPTPPLNRANGHTPPAGAPAAGAGAIAPTPAGMLPPLDPTRFTRPAAAGYKRRLIPITPADAELRLPPADPDKDNRGKSPGFKGKDEKWGGFVDWPNHPTSDEDLATWAAWGAGVGIRCGQDEQGRGVYAIDVDINKFLPDDERKAHSAKARAVILEWCLAKHPGATVPLRYGREHNFITPVRIDGDELPGMTATLRDVNETKLGSIDIIGRKRQFVAHGQHPSGKPYTWTTGCMPPLGELMVFTRDDLKDLFARLKAVFPHMPEVRISGQRSVTPRMDLEAQSFEEVRRLVAVIPNKGVFDDYGMFCNMGFAIKGAAGPHHEDEAQEVWEEWANSWAHPQQRGKVRTLFATARPRELGVGWLQTQARLANGGKVVPASVWFTRPGDGYADNDNDAFGDFFIPNDGATTGPYILSMVSTADTLPPPRDILYGGHYARKHLSVTTAPTKVGKTSLSIIEALAMASGKPLLGVAPVAPLRVWLHNAEDPLDEMKRLQRAAMQHYGLTDADLGNGRLKLTSGRETPIILATSSPRGVIVDKAVIQRVRDTIGEHGADVVSFDPLISVHHVSENITMEMQRVAEILRDDIADKANAAVEVKQHTKKGSTGTIEDARGSVALISAARSVRSLVRIHKGNKGFELKDFDALKTINEKTPALLKGRKFFVIADAQSNFAMGGEDATVFEMVDVTLNNARLDGPYPIPCDRVGVVTVFKSGGEPDAFSGEPGGGGPDTIEEGSRAARRKLAAEHLRSLPQPARTDWRAGNWAGDHIAQFFDDLPSRAEDESGRRRRLSDILEEMETLDKSIERGTVAEGRKDRPVWKVVTAKPE